VSVVPFDRFRNYFDDTIACEALQGNQPEVVHEVLAKRILHAARWGERDADRLREIALAGIIPPDTPGP
jgi:hypothetical protein